MCLYHIRYAPHSNQMIHAGSAIVQCICGRCVSGGLPSLLPGRERSMGSIVVESSPIGLGAGTDDGRKDSCSSLPWAPTVQLA